ncbi:MAG: 1-acyl-sn-glycerol-3-phosphate acyltransferase [Phycisphaerales bacterium]|nr:1-acyl-sn-glycerol-3-phosphate acyltransferase [Phycisphaerales bacterium]
MPVPNWWDTGWWAVGGGAAWVCFALWSRALLNNPRRDVEGGLAIFGMKAYSRLVHRLHVRGRGNRPSISEAGPLIVVANHTAGIDPILLQAVCPFEIRFMMAEDMQVPELAKVWAWTRVIPVIRTTMEGGVGAGAGGGGRRKGSDARAALVALRHLKGGGVLGVFPEGGIARPPGQLMPFLPGVGFLVKRSGAPVLPAVITGTPEAKTAWGSFFKPSRSVVEFLPLVHPAADATPEQIAEDLQARFRGALERLA